MLDSNYLWNSLFLQKAQSEISLFHFKTELSAIGEKQDGHVPGVLKPSWGSPVGENGEHCTNSVTSHFILWSNWEVFTDWKQAGCNTRAHWVRGSDLKRTPFRAGLKFWFFQLLFLARLVSSRRLRKACWHHACLFLLVHVPGEDAGEELNHTEINPNAIAGVGACVTPFLTCFPNREGVLQLMQCCHLADFIPNSVAF